MRTGRQRLGQHFLNRPDLADRIVSAAEIHPGEDVIEIGPGRGILTERLLSANAKVLAIELDPGLYEGLLGRFRDNVSSGLLTLQHADFLKLDLAQLPRPVKIVANLPYAVAAPILQRILAWDGWEVAVLMFQKEVAERILAGPGSRKYGTLSVSTALKSHAAHICDVPRGCFTPPPKVDSAVVRFDRLKERLLPEGLSEGKFFSIIKGAFSQRRKTMANSLSQSLKLPRAQVESAMQKAAIDLMVRPERVALDSFISLAQELSSVVLS